MMIAIIAAMDSELDFLLNNVKINEKIDDKPFTYYLGDYFNHQLIIAKSGVGKVSAGMLFSSLIHKFSKINLVINIGVAGGTKGKVNIFDMVVIDKAVYGDVDIRLGGDYVYGQMSKCPPCFNLHLDNFLSKLPYKKGSVMTCDRFMSNKKEIDDIVSNFFKEYNIVCYDMETTAFAQAAYIYNIPFIATRAISDIIGENNSGEFERNAEKAANISGKFVIDLLENIKV